MSCRNRIFYDMDTQKASSCRQSITVLLNALYTRVSGTLGVCRFPLLPAIDPTYSGRMGEKRKRSIKELCSTVASIDTSSVDITAVSAYMYCRGVWYYIECRETQSNWNYCGSDESSTMNYHMQWYLPYLNGV